MKLKPCPECHSNNIQLYSQYAYNFMVTCLDCGLTSPSRRLPYRVIEVWNDRKGLEDNKC